MNVNDLLAFKPETPRTSTLENPIPPQNRQSRFSDNSAQKRPVKGERVALDLPDSKYRRLNDGSAVSDTLIEKPQTAEKPSFVALSSDFASTSHEEKYELNETGDELDESSVKKMVLQLEKKALKNQEMRVKFADQPAKFLQSETDLYDILQEMQVLGTVPDLYPILVQHRSVQTLLQLVSHDNVDIALAVIDLINELTEPDTLQESPERAGLLMDAFLREKLISVLIQNVSRLNEAVKDEADGVHNLLGIVENLLEFDPAIAADIAQQGLLAWLLKRIQKLSFDANKLYVSEIMSILLTGVEDNITLFGELNGIDIVLQQLAAYKRNDPGSREECEMMQNVFDCLSAALSTKANHERFLKGEGPQLMILMLRFKKLARNNSLRVLDYAMSYEAATETCNKFVDNFGLRHLFPLFMRTPKRKYTDQKRVGPNTAELEEHIINCVAGLLRHCTGSKKERILQKFTENNHEKTERLVELHFRYFEKTKDSDKVIEKEKENPSLWTATSNEEMEEEVYNRRLIGGLFVLQQIDIMILEVAVNADRSVSERILKLLRVRNVSASSICRIAEECCERLGEGAHTEKKRITELLEKFITVLS